MYKAHLLVELNQPCLKNLRIVFEGTLKDHLVQTSCNQSGAHSPIQPNLGCLQGWGTHYLFGQLVPALHQLYWKKVRYIQSQSSLL